MSARGRVWKFGDDVNTDLIIAGKYLECYDPAHLAAHAMEGANKEFASGVKKGDIIVAGANFGCGSSREQAVMALKHAGVSAVVAKSFARIFYRNAINLGLPVVISTDAADSLRDSEVVALDLASSSLTTEGGKGKVILEPIPLHVKKILDCGGLVPYIKAKLRNG
jgi:3-isopropylmalate/(R)-2-methylmalate dehydratase small subunit